MTNEEVTIKTDTYFEELPKFCSRWFKNAGETLAKVYRAERRICRKKY